MADGPGSPQGEGSASPSGAGGATEVAADPSPVEVTEGRLGFVPYAWALRRPGGRLRVVLLTLLPVYLLGLLAIVPVQLAGDTAVVNGELEVLAARPVLVVTGIVLLLLGVVSAVVAHAAATLVALAESVRFEPTAPAGVGRGVEQAPSGLSLRDAVATAVRRLPTLAVLTLLGMLLFLATIAAVVGLLAVEVVTWLAIGVPCVAGWLAFSPFAVAFPVALAEHRGPFAALRRSVQLTGGRALGIGLAVLVFGYGIPGAASYLVTRLPDLLGPLAGPWTLAVAASVLNWALTVVGLTVLASVQVSALLRGKTVADPRTVATEMAAYPGSRHPVKDVLDRDRVLAVLRRRTAEWRWLAQSRRDLGVRVTAAMIVPGLLASGLLWWNPARVPAYTKAQVAADDSDVRATPVAMPDGSTVVVRPLSTIVVVGRCVGDRCARSATDEDADDMRLGGMGVTAGAGDRLVFSGWLGDDGDGLDALRLVSCEPARCAEDATDGAPVLDRYHPSEDSGHVGAEVGPSDVRTAVTRDGKGGYVVASVMAGAGVTVYRCADPRCQRPSKARLRGPDDLAFLPSDARLLSVDAHRGRVAVTVVDTRTGEVTLFGCADLRCARPSTTELVPPGRSDPELSSQSGLGAQVAFLPDGRPVVAYRDTDGRVRLVSCADLECAERSVRSVTGPGSAHPPPAVVVDGTGLPLVATYDLAEDHLVLVSCRDARCARRDTVPIAAADEGPGSVGLSLDERGRPVLVWSDVDPSRGPFEDGPIRTVRCHSARCGAPAPGG